MFCSVLSEVQAHAFIASTKSIQIDLQSIVIVGEDEKFAANQFLPATRSKAYFAKFVPEDFFIRKTSKTHKNIKTEFINKWLKDENIKTYDKYQDDDIIDFFGKELKKNGYNYYGNENMYSGIFGNEMKVDIYMGLVYY